MFSFSDDVLGFGKMTGGAGGTAECGSRPNCVAWLDKDCGSKNKAYNDCVDKAMQIKAQTQTRQTTGKGKNQILIVVAVVIGAIILFKVFTKNKAK